MAAATVLHQAVLRFGVPDTSVGVEERGLYAFPANKSVKEHSFPLRDARTAPELLPGMAGIDAQGFAFVQHKSALQDAQDWLTGDAVEKTYIPEMEQLACEVTGATRAVVMDASFRLKPADEQVKLNWYRKRGDAIDEQVALMPKSMTAGAYCTSSSTLCLVHVLTLCPQSTAVNRPAQSSPPARHT